MASYSSSTSNPSAQVPTIGPKSQTDEGIDKSPYILKYRNLMNEKRFESALNAMLHKRLVDYYKKRKMDYALKEVRYTPGGVHFDARYKERLREYKQIKTEAEKEMQKVLDEVQKEQAICDEKEQHAQENFKQLQHSEASSGYGLIYSQKGKPISDKLVNQHLHFQKLKFTEVSQMQLRFIRARNAVTDLQNILQKLELIGPGLFVSTYEQLKFDNLNLLDKIEERNYELNKIRSRYDTSNQMLAHIREKMNFTEELMERIEADMGDIQLEYLKSRDDLNHIKIKRNKLRIALNDELQKAGLLSRPILLLDFEECEEDVIRMQATKAFLTEGICSAKRKRSLARLLQERKSITSSACFTDKSDE